MREVTLNRLMTLTAVAALVASAAVPVGARAGKNMGECPAERVFVADVKVHAKAGTDGDQIHEGFVAELYPALQKARFQIVQSRDSLGPNDVTLTVEVRAWTARHANGRVTLDLSSTQAFPKCLQDGSHGCWSPHRTDRGYDGARWRRCLRLLRRKMVADVPRHGMPQSGALRPCIESCIGLPGRRGSMSVSMAKLLLLCY